MSSQPTVPPTSLIPTWTEFRMVGSRAILEEGYAATKKSPKTCNESWFSSDATVILGLAAKLDSEEPKPTRAKWLIPLPKKAVSRIKDAVLAIVCARRFGGLHSKRQHARVSVQFNGQPVDVFELKSKAEGHHDYFHRDISPNLPADSSLSKYKTIYTWALSPGTFQRGADGRLLAIQTVSVDIDSDVNWDIDEVGLLVMRHALPVRVWVITILLVAFSGVAVALLSRTCR